MGIRGRRSVHHRVCGEAAEETGLEDLVAWPSAEILHVVAVPVPAGKGEPAHEHADVRYVLATSLTGFGTARERRCPDAVAVGRGRARAHGGGEPA